jgi:hypothetical protein
MKDLLTNSQLDDYESYHLDNLFVDQVLGYMYHTTTLEVNDCLSRKVFRVK